MATELPFTDHQSLEARYAQLRIARDKSVLRFEDHVFALRDKAVRGTLLKSGVKGVVEDIEPLQWMKRTLTGGGIASTLLMGMITHKGGIVRRLLTSVLAMAAPNLLAKVPWTKVLDSIRGNGHAKAHDLGNN